MLENSAQVRQRIFRQLLGEPDGAIEVREFFRMSQWQEKKGLLPGSLQIRIVAESKPSSVSARAFGSCAYVRAVSL